MKFLMLLALVATVAVAQAAYQSVAAVSSEYSASERVLSYASMGSGNAAVVTTPYGTLKMAMGGNFPFLTSITGPSYPGMSQLQVMLQPCSAFAPHSHPRADEMLQVINGTLSGVLIDEFNNGNQTVYPFELGPLDLTVFPRGLAHSWWNPGCEPSYSVLFFDSIDPGTVLLIPTTLSLPTLPLQAALGVNSTRVGSILSMVNQQGVFMPLNDPTCNQKCNIPYNGS